MPRLNEFGDEFDESALFNDEEFDLDEFIGSAYPDRRRRGSRKRRGRPPGGRRAIEERNDYIRLRKQIADWDEWDDWDTEPDDRNLFV